MAVCSYMSYHSANFVSPHDHVDDASDREDDEENRSFDRERVSEDEEDDETSRSFDRERASKSEDDPHFMRADDYLRKLNQKSSSSSSDYASESPIATRFDARSQHGSPSRFDLSQMGARRYSVEDAADDLETSYSDAKRVANRLNTPPRYLDPAAFSSSVRNAPKMDALRKRWASDNSDPRNSTSSKAMRRIY